MRPKLGVFFPTSPCGVLAFNSASAFLPPSCRVALCRVMHTTRLMRSRSFVFHPQILLFLCVPTFSTQASDVGLSGPIILLQGNVLWEFMQEGQLRVPLDDLLGRRCGMPFMVTDT